MSTLWFSWTNPSSFQVGPSCNGSLPHPGGPRTHDGLTFYSVDRTTAQAGVAGSSDKHTSRSGMADLDESGECIGEPLAISCACAA